MLATSACRSTATRSTRRGPRSRASPSCSAAPRPGTSSATTGRSRPPPTTATCSCGARTASTSGSTATQPDARQLRRRLRVPAHGRRRDQHALRRTGRRARARGASSAWATAAPAAPAPAAWRVDERVYAPFGDGPVLLHDVTIRNTGARAAQRILVRVLGREPVRPGGQALDRAWSAPRYSARHAHAHASPSAPRAPDRRPLTIFAAALSGPVARLRPPTPRASSAPATARPAGRGGGRAPRRGHRPGHTGRIRGPGDVGLPRAVEAAPGTRGHAALRLRHRAARRRSRALVARRRERRAGRSPAASERGRAGCRRSGSGAGARGSRASSSGPRTRCARARPTRSAAAGTSSPRAATTSTTSASRAPSATRSSTCSR